MHGQVKIFHVGSHQFRESLRELLRELWVSYCSSRGVPFREWNFVFREWNFEFRELLREYPGTLRELREWPLHSESVLPEIGVVPRLLINSLARLFTIYCLKRCFGSSVCRSGIPGPQKPKAQIINNDYNHLVLLEWCIHRMDRMPEDKGAKMLENASVS